MDDILTMQVWIPRYKYKVWNYNSNGTVGSEPQEIEIMFKEGKNATGDITCRDETCQEIGINNNSNYITGCGSSAGSSSSSTCNSYDTEQGMLASTTGNIYGVYDMSGGAYDYAMGNIVSKNGTTMMSGYSNAYNSGYTGIIYNSGNYMSYTGISYPNSKYYDKYSFGTSNTGMIRSKLGDSIKEVYNKDNDNWYNARSWIVHSSGPWFSRSGYYNDSALVGLFFSSYNYGSASGSCSSRFVIIP